MSDNFTDQDIVAFNEKMFRVIAECMSDLPLEKLVELHELVYARYEENEGSDEEPPFAFALTALDEAIRQKQFRQALN